MSKKNRWDNFDQYEDIKSNDFHKSKKSKFNKQGDYSIDFNEIELTDYEIQKNRNRSKYEEKKKRKRFDYDDYDYDGWN